MARIRTIKPAFFRSQQIADLPLATRLTFIGLWTYVDDAGRGIDDPRLVKGDLWPLDEKHTTKKVEADLVVLSEAGMIERYELGGKRYLRVIGFREHQRVNRPNPSLIPASFTESSVSNPGEVPEDSRTEGNKEQEREQEREEEQDSSSQSPTSLLEPTALDDDPILIACQLLAIADLERRTIDKPDSPVGDRKGWLAEAGLRRLANDGGPLRLLQAAHPEWAGADLAAAFLKPAPKPSPLDATQAAGYELMRRNAENRPAMPETPQPVPESVRALLKKEPA